MVDNVRHIFPPELFRGRTLTFSIERGKLIFLVELTPLDSRRRAEVEVPEEVLRDLRKAICDRRR